MIRVKEAITAGQPSQRKPPGERAGPCGLVSEHQPCRVSVQGHRSNRRKGEDGTLMARLNVRFWGAGSTGRRNTGVKSLCRGVQGEPGLEPGTD